MKTFISLQKVCHEGHAKAYLRNDKSLLCWAMPIPTRCWRFKLGRKRSLDFYTVFDKFEPFSYFRALPKISRGKRLPKYCDMILVFQRSSNDLQRIFGGLHWFFTGFSVTFNGFWWFSFIDFLWIFSDFDVQMIFSALWHDFPKSFLHRKISTKLLIWFFIVMLTIYFNLFTLHSFFLAKNISL